MRLKGPLRILLVVALLAAILVAVAASGVVSVAADVPQGGWIDEAANFVALRSIAAHASELPAPMLQDEDTLAEGLGHFRDNCLPCHGAPGAGRAEFALGLNPAPPDLASREIQARSDGQLHWIVTHGIRATGMPAFSPTHSAIDVLAIVAFVRHLPWLTEKEAAELAAAAPRAAHHHDRPDEPPHEAAQDDHDH
jgi:mono/diheme cytochrome c family protein